MTGRAVPEWVGKTPDAKVPDRVRLRVLNANKGLCYLSGLPIGSKKWEIEHVKALSLGGENRESNLRPALVEAHKLKTKAEAKDRAKADAIAKKAAGIKPVTQPIQSRGFPGSAPKPDKKEAARSFYQGIARRPMFVDAGV